MDWNKVIENLKAQADFYTKQANESGMMSGYHERTKQYRMSADMASILWSALKSGMEK